MQSACAWRLAAGRGDIVYYKLSNSIHSVPGVLPQAAAVAKALEVNQTLITLDLSNNDIGATITNYDSNWLAKQHLDSRCVLAAIHAPKTSVSLPCTNGLYSTRNGGWFMIGHLPWAYRTPHHRCWVERLQPKHVSNPNSIMK